VGKNGLIPGFRENPQIRKRFGKGGGGRKQQSCLLLGRLQGCSYQAEGRLDSKTRTQTKLNTNKILCIALRRDRDDEGAGGGGGGGITSLSKQFGGIRGGGG